MRNKSSFDNMLKFVMNSSVSRIEASRDIFEDAWEKKDISAYKKHIVGVIRKTALITACYMILFIGTTLSVSADARALAVIVYNNIRTIFDVKKVDGEYKIIEKPEDDTVIDYWNIGGVGINESNRVNFEQLLGFKFYFPEKAGEFTRYGDPSVGLSVKSIRLKEEEKLTESFFNAIENEAVFNELDQYSKKRFISVIYKDSAKIKYYFSIAKEEKDTEDSKIKEDAMVTDIVGIKCRYLEVPHVQYTKKHEGKWTSNDITEMPLAITKAHRLVWNYEDKTFSITSSKDLDFDTARSFVQEYMKAFKQQE